MGLHKIRYNVLWDGIAQTRYNVAFSINSVTVNMGKRNSVKSRLLVKNTDVCFGGVLAIWYIMWHVKER